MKVAIYSRVSTADQNTQNQISELVDFAERNKFDYEVFEEQESTRRTRPVKEKVLNLLRKKKFDGLLVWKLDRWARSLPELSLELTELFDKGIKFISLKDNIDLSTATGKLQFHIISAFAEFERDLIRERTSLSMKQIDKEIKEKGFYISKQGNKITQRGRPKGSKDKGRRRKSGYYQRWSRKDPPVK